MQSPVKSAALRLILLSLSAAAGLAAIAPSTRADTVAIIGTGEVGSALGPRISGLGNRVVYGSRSPQRADVAALVGRSGDEASADTPAAAAGQADIVVLAVPWYAAEEVVRGLGDLSGKIIMDPTNPRSESEDGFRDYAFDSSNAERIQKLAPNAMVVKAFNTMGADTMAAPRTAGGPVTVPLVGDSKEAKEKVAAIAQALGFEPLDLGPLRFARIIEGLHYLRYNAAFLGTPFNYYFRKSGN
jgi:predicted dinucleotide-binding enzyme